MFIVVSPNPFSAFRSLATHSTARRKYLHRGFACGVCRVGGSATPSIRHFISDLGGTQHRGAELFQQKSDSCGVADNQRVWENRHVQLQEKTAEGNRDNIGENTDPNFESNTTQSGEMLEAARNLPRCTSIGSMFVQTTGTVRVVLESV
eukprot:5526489-Amphidinium_carterae.1